MKLMLKCVKKRDLYINVMAKEVKYSPSNERTIIPNGVY